MRRLTAVILAAGFALPAFAHETGAPHVHPHSAAALAGDVTVAEAWARPSLVPGGASAAYFTVSTDGAADRLIAVSSPVAARVELHSHTVDEAGVARMRPVAAVAVEPGSPTALVPGGLHVMLMGLDRPLSEGETVPLTLVFERAGELTVEAPVRGPGASGGAGHSG